MRGRLALLLACLVAPLTARAADLLADAARADTELEERMRAVLVHGLDQDWRALEADVHALEAFDERQAEDGLPRSGLTDDVRYLAAGLVLTRDGRRAALEDVLRNHPDAVVRKLTEHRLEADDAVAATQLLADDRHNRRAALLNDAVRPLGVFSGTAFLGAINPFLLAGSAVDSVLTTAVNLWHYNHLTSQEREALARYRLLAARGTRTDEAPEIVQAIHRLGTKRAEALCESTVDLGTKALEHDDLDHARFYLESARDLEGCDGRLEKPRTRLTEALARRAAHEDAALWPVDEPPQAGSAEEIRNHEAVAIAAAGGEPSAMIEAAQRFLARHDDSDLAPGARLVVAVARDLAGHRESAREALAELARDGDSSAGRYAAAVLASPDFNRLDAIADAERRHGRQVVRYVLLGRGLDGRTAVYTAAQFGAQGMAAAQSFGIFNVIGMVTRAWQAWRRDPASNQEIIDRGEEFLAREPHSPDASAVHERLATAYERADNCGRALMHYRETADPDPERVAKLEGKIADHLLEEAEKSGGDRVRLETIVNHFGDTKAAKKAREKLHDRHDTGETAIDRALLEASPALAGPSGLDLDPALLDGNRANGELSDAGVTLADGSLRLQLRNEDGPGERFETRPLSPEAFARARGAAEEALYARALTTERRDPDTGRYERWVPFYVQGAVGEDGSVFVAPGVKLRRYKSDDRALYE